MADRISSLPETILCHILSFLPTKQAIATSVLSQRWKTLWRFVPTLDFDDANYIQSQEIPVLDLDDVNFYIWHRSLVFYDYIKRKDTYLGFVRFVSAVLLLRDWHQPIQKFSLKCSSVEFCDLTHVPTWIHAVLQRRVEHLHLSLPPRWLWNADPITSIINCSTLVVLKLENLYVELPSFPYFPSLKILHMEKVEIYDHLCLSKFLSGCPILKEFRQNTIFFRFEGIYAFEIIPVINCITLVVLKLNDILLEPPSSVHFPSLKILHVKNSSIIGLLHFSKFLSACPILEDLKTDGLLVYECPDQLKTTRTLYPLAEQEIEIPAKLVKASRGRSKSCFSVESYYQCKISAHK